MINFPQRNWTDYGGEVNRYVYTGTKPLPDPDIIQLIKRPLKLAERVPTRTRVLERVMDYVDTYIHGVAA